ncbi:alkaline shock response membrane anchor protein AmaP [Streptomyces sp. NPDC029674]|uniref:alkaline shock response membrane anchor protein AmaP n=1 Tax=Streptomyces sp. NPDC029674 TaxID=3365297 RepID=UPI0038501086
MSRLRGGVNRAALLCVAVACVGAGAVLATAADAVRDRLPSGWPRLGADRVWLDGRDLGRWRDQGWWTPLVIAALSVGVLLFVVWVLAQVRGGRLRELPLGQPDVTLSGTALAAAMAERARAIEGVADAHVRLRGTSRRLRARITLVLLPDSSPETVLRSLALHTVAEARAATAPRALDADVRLRVRSHKSRRLR